MSSRSSLIHLSHLVITSSPQILMNSLFNLNKTSVWNSTEIDESKFNRVKSCHSVSQQLKSSSRNSDRISPVLLSRPTVCSSHSLKPFHLARQSMSLPWYTLWTLQMCDRLKIIGHRNNDSLTDMYRGQEFVCFFLRHIKENNKSFSLDLPNERYSWKYVYSNLLS